MEMKAAGDRVCQPKHQQLWHHTPSDPPIQVNQLSDSSEVISDFCLSC